MQIESIADISFGMGKKYVPGQYENENLYRTGGVNWKNKKGKARAFLINTIFRCTFSTD